MTQKKRTPQTTVQNPVNVSKNVPEYLKVIQKVVKRELTRTSQNIQKWRSATISAESILNPNRVKLLEIYKDVILDAHLSSVMNTIKLKVKSGEIYICNADKSENEDLTKKIRDKWFRDYLDFYVDALFYGHSLIQINGISNDRFIDLELVPRENVVPEFGIVKTNAWSHATDGVDFRSEPYSDWLIEIGQKNDLGILHKATPLTLWKKGVFGAWSQYAELFGMPLRIGKTDILNPANRVNMEKMLENMGSASWGVFNLDDQIEFINGNGSTSSFEIYDKMIDRVNTEISKLVLGQTGTTDEKSFTGSANVHASILADYISAIKTDIVDHVHKIIIPKMKMFGMLPNQDLTFKFEDNEQIPIDKHFEITKELLNFYNIPAEWIAERFNVPVEEKDIQTQTTSVLPDVANLYKNAIV
jgi:hypothetical protein